MILKHFERCLFWVLLLSFLVGSVVLLFWVPLVPGIFYVVLVTGFAIGTAKGEGFWSWVRAFLKDMLFGW